MNKNIHILPTDRLSRLAYVGANDLCLGKDYPNTTYCKPQNIHITSDEEIKEGDWFYNPFINEIQINCNPDGCKKIILTTDLQLIADGVQAIDDTFLEWFCSKNGNIDFVEVIKVEDEKN